MLSMADAAPAAAEFATVCSSIHPYPASGVGLVELAKLWEQDAEVRDLFRQNRGCCQLESFVNESPGCKIALTHR